MGNEVGAVYDSRMTASSQAQVARLIRAWVESRKLPVGAKLPSSRALAAELGVHFSTVSRALRELEVRNELRRDGYRMHWKGASHPSGLDPVHFITMSAEPVEVVGEVAALHGAGCEAKVVKDLSRLPGEVLRRFEGGARLFLLYGYLGGRELIERIERRGGSVMLISPQTFPGLPGVEGDQAAASAMAVEYLLRKGHRELAFVGYPPTLDMRIERESGYVSACAKHGLAASAARVFYLEEVVDLRTAPAAWFKGESRATAIVVGADPFVRAILEWLKSLALRVPRDVSVVSCSDGPACRASLPPTTAFQIDLREEARIAATLLLARAREKDLRGVAAPATLIRMLPTLRERRSCAALAPSGHLGDGVALSRGVVISRNENLLSLPADKRRAEASATWRTSYALAKRTAPGGFFPLRLRSALNRDVNRQNAWLGDEPLLYFDAGAKLIHGVRFEIGTRRNSSAPAALVLRNASSLPRRKSLPSRVRIPVGRKIRALYILHACGYVSGPGPMATYRFLGTDGTGEELDIVPMVGIEQIQASSPVNPNIQDWWPGFPQFNTASAHHLVVTEEGDPALYARYLYTLEWRPAAGTAFVDSWEIALKTETTAVLTVLAATAILA